MAVTRTSRGVLRLAGAWAAPLLACLACGAEPTRATISGGYHDFGAVPHGTRPTHTFVVCRGADRPFTVRGVVAQCSCAHTRLSLVGPDGVRRDTPPASRPGDTLAVARGEGLDLEVEFDTTLRHAIDSGPLPFDVVLATDLPDQPEALFKCDARIRSRLEIKPGPLLDLGLVADRQAASATLELAPRDGRSFAVRAIHGAEESGLVIEKIAAAPGVHLYRIDSPPGRTFDGDGRFLKFLRFETDLDGGYEFQVQVQAQRLAPVRVEPSPKISFGQIEMTEPATGFVTVRRSTGGPLELSVQKLQLQVGGKAQSPEGLLDVSFEPQSATRSVRVQLRYTGKLTAREFRGTLLLATNEPDQPEVEIEFVGFAKK